MGVHMCIALATIMLVWFGVQEALASAQGGPGSAWRSFLNFFMLITFAYVLGEVLRQLYSGHRVLAQRIY